MKVREILRRNFKIVKWIHKESSSYLPLMLLEEGLKTLRLYLSIWVSARVVDKIVAGYPREEIINLAVWLVLLNCVLALVQWGIDKVLIVKRRSVEEGWKVSMARKSLTMDYQVLENAKTQDIVKQIEEGENYAGGINGYCQNLAWVARSILVVFYSVFALIPLFRTEILPESGFPMVLLKLMNSFWIVLFVAIVFFFFIWQMHRAIQKINTISNANFEYAVPNNRKFFYFKSYILDYAKGKSVRIYNMLPLIMQKVREVAADNKRIWYREVIQLKRINAKRKYLFCFCMLLAYFYVGLKVIGGAISIGELAFYVGIFMNLFECISETMNIVGFMVLKSQYLFNYVEFLELPNEKYEGTLPVEKRLDNEYELEFRNVSFHYPNSKEMVLEHVNARIHVGRKMAIVGPNGCGKSTFIKLLCRLYDPTEGEILLNGIDIRKYDYDEYRNLFGVVFQDFQLFAFSVAQNVAAGTVYEEERVWSCLEQAGLKVRVQDWEKGIHTPIYKQGDEGVEISGGEAQKLAIARALYRDAPVVILDEPTAALDPVAELEIYEKFNELVEDKTAIFISHRMSSCRFCKNILVFEGGKIVQMGSHEALLQEEEGLYAKLWNAQAQYYA